VTFLMRASWVPNTQPPGYCYLLVWTQFFIIQVLGHSSCERCIRERGDKEANIIPELFQTPALYSDEWKAVNFELWNTAICKYDSTRFPKLDLQLTVVPYYPPRLVNVLTTKNYVLNITLLTVLKVVILMWMMVTSCSQFNSFVHTV
jgi:hypothetical protein